MSLFMYGYYESPCELPSHFVTQFDKDYLVVVFFFNSVFRGKEREVVSIRFSWLLILALLGCSSR